MTQVALSPSQIKRQPGSLEGNGHARRITSRQTPRTPAFDKLVEDLRPFGGIAPIKPLPGSEMDEMLKSIERAKRIGRV